MPKKRIVIEKMTEEDIDEALAIEQDVFPSPWTRGMFLQELSSEDSCFIVAREKERLIGYGGFFMIGEVARLENLAVHPEFRRHGVAMRIMKKLFTLIKASGGKEITLEVRPGNQGAQNLYRKFGFLISGKRPEYYSNNGEDALIMSCSIGI